MYAFNRILVPVDFSESSRAAVDYATAIGARFGAEIDLLHVWRPPGELESKTELLLQFSRSEEGHQMMAWLDAVNGYRDIETHGRVAPGTQRDVPDAIVEAVRVGNYDLVVMGTHTHRGLLHQLLGGATERVIRRAPCPVVTIHGDEITPDVFADTGAMKASGPAESRA